MSGVKQAQKQPRPGEYASYLARSRYAKAALFAATAALAGLLAVQRGPAKVLERDPISLMLLSVALIAGLAARTKNREALRATRGASSEVSVGRILERSRLGVVLHGVDLRAGGDADHVLIGDVAVVIETKTGRGEVRYSKKDGMTAGTRRIPGDPVRQAQRQATALHRRIGVWTTAIVCVTDMTNPPFREGETIVLSQSDLVNAIRHLPRTMDDFTREQALRSLGA